MKKKKKWKKPTIFVVFQSNWIRVRRVNSLLLAPRANSLTIFVVPTNRSSSIYTQHFFFRLSLHCCLLFLAWFHDYYDCLAFLRPKKIYILILKHQNTAIEWVSVCWERTRCSSICAKDRAFADSLKCGKCGKREKEPHLMPLIITPNALLTLLWLHFQSKRPCSVLLIHIRILTAGQKLSCCIGLQRSQAYDLISIRECLINFQIIRYKMLWSTKINNCENSFVNAWLLA